MDEKHWQQFGEQLAMVVIQEGAQIGLALLSGFLSKKLGTPIQINPLPPTQ